jgi:hypothetical protein
MASGGTSGQQAFFVCVSVVLHLCVHHLLECKSSKMAHFVFKCNKEDYLSLLECLGFTWYLPIALPVQPIPPHDVFKELPSLSPYAHPKAWW